VTGLLMAAASVAGPAVPAASAVTFSVSPTQLVLSGRTRSSLLTIRNDSAETLRFQLSAFAWQQSPGGTMTLEPTEDVVFFPALFTLGAGEERRIRVGSLLTGSPDTERTYRLFVEELPPLDLGSAKAPGIRVLTKMGIPIFVRPDQERASADLGALAVRGADVSFTLSNTGAVHFVPRRVVARGLDADGQALFELELSAWYVLAGGRRDFDVASPARDCDRVRSLVIEADLGFATLTERLGTGSGVCQP
jgi:fimbrial chaperone protein